jgi:hypothetical protein
MATVYDRKESSATATTSIIVTMPSGIVAGDKLLVAVASSVTSAFTAAGWTIAQEGGSSHRSAIVHKVAVGGDTLTVSGGNGNWLARAWGIRGATGEVAVIAVNGTLVDTNPALLATGWAANVDSNLWLCILSSPADVPSVPPSGFADMLTSGGGGAALGLGSAERLDPAVTLDPSNWTIPAGNKRAYTIAVRSQGIVQGGANLPVPIAAGQIAEVGEPPVNYIRDHARRAILSLNPVFWGKPRIASFVWAITTEVQELEDAILSVISLRMVDNAGDVQLEVLGRIVGQRNTGGFDTELYRSIIKAKIRTNRSRGTLRDILEVVRLIHPAGASWFVAGWATLGLIVRQVPIGALEALSIVLRNAKQAEEGVLVYVEQQAGQLICGSATSAVAGAGVWGSASNPAVGGLAWHVRRISALSA